MKKPIFLVAAADRNLGIGIQNTLPWRLKKELEYFQNLTTKTKDPEKENLVIMGRKTWDSLPSSSRPLKNRKNIVISRQENLNLVGAEVAPSLDGALKLASEKTETIYIIGGASIYKEAINHPLTDGVYLTRIEEEFDCDAFFPSIPEIFSHREIIGEDEEKNLSFKFLRFSKS